MRPFWYDRTGQHKLTQDELALFRHNYAKFSWMLRIGVKGKPAQTTVQVRHAIAKLSLREQYKKDDEIEISFETLQDELAYATKILHALFDQWKTAETLEWLSLLNKRWPSQRPKWIFYAGMTYDHMFLCEQAEDAFADVLAEESCDDDLRYLAKYWKAVASLNCFAEQHDEVAVEKAIRELSVLEECIFVTLGMRGRSQLKMAVGYDFLGRKKDRNEVLARVSDDPRGVWCSRIVSELQYSSLEGRWDDGLEAARTLFKHFMMQPDPVHLGTSEPFELCFREIINLIDARSLHGKSYQAQLMELSAYVAEVCQRIGRMDFADAIRSDVMLSLDATDDLKAKLAYLLEGKKFESQLGDGFDLDIGDLGQ